LNLNRILKPTIFSKTTLEHVGQFILQCGEAIANDRLKLRLFPLSCLALLLHSLLLLLLILYSLGLNYNKKIMNTFILAIPSLDCLILLLLSKSIMSSLLIALGGLEILGIDALI
jgi:hypothetical protein